MLFDVPVPVVSRWKAVTLFLLVAVTVLAAQQPPTMSVDVKVVNVLATVRDKHGNIVNNLTKDDFVLEEEGRPQTIRYFTRETDLPLSFGLLVDTSRSQRQALDDERTGSASFINSVLREDRDHAFLIHFDHEVELLEDVTSSRQKLVSKLQELQESPQDSQQSADDPGQGRRGGWGRGTLLYDSIFLASDEIMQKQQGRKAIIVLSDGVDHGSKTSLEHAIETAQRANTIVYSIYYPGQEPGDRHRGTGGGLPGGGRVGGGWPGGGGGWPGGGGYPGGGGRYPGGGGGYPGGGRTPRPSSEDGKKVLERLSRETGGHMFMVSKKETIADIYKQIENELRNQYSLGYTSDKIANEGSDYRHIHVTTKQKDLTVQAREGYYPSQQVVAKQSE